ncbi:hypothetical protein [Methanocaldococcus fervens]|uniref:Uncharacterized protein n=1 Tax=Methanocaldococcus fervens (strain DSM 4213 / JCM 15782 / AG86) TaxID=573064 RepID=C7P6R3_METFA|nr:hypothetical protein [Methanocaldococcus fervens]ACV24245.1 hypothetical protein Mefer_0419 [Methanocaldococcus fervens AG86]
MDDKVDWLNKLIEELDKGSSNIAKTEILSDEIITKLNELISEINNYVNEIHYGLKITNERINLSVSELSELEKKLNEYLTIAENMKEYIENTHNEIMAIKSEMEGIKRSLEKSSLKVDVENSLKTHDKKIEILKNNIKSLSKTQQSIIGSLTYVKTLLYITIALTIVNTLISLKVSGIIG